MDQLDSAIPELVAYELVILLVLWSHLKCMLSSPGYVPKDYTKYKQELLPERCSQVLDIVTHTRKLEKLKC